jgi:stage V sporulation protein G
MEITEVRISLNKGGKVRAFAQLIIDNCFLIGDIRVLEGKEGTVYVAMPSRRLRNGGLRDVAHPLNAETRRRIDDLILNEYQRVVSERGPSAEGDDGSSRTQQIANRLLADKFWTDEDTEPD